MSSPKQLSIFLPILILSFGLSTISSLKAQPCKNLPQICPDLVFQKDYDMLTAFDGLVWRFKAGTVAKGTKNNFCHCRYTANAQIWDGDQGMTGVEERTVGANYIDPSTNSGYDFTTLRVFQYVAYIPQVSSGTCVQSDTSTIKEGLFTTHVTWGSEELNVSNYGFPDKIIGVSVYEKVADAFIMDSIIEKSQFAFDELSLSASDRCCGMTTYCKDLTYTPEVIEFPYVVKGDKRLKNFTLRNESNRDTIILKDFEFVKEDFDLGDFIDLPVELLPGYELELSVEYEPKEDYSENLDDIMTWTYHTTTDFTEKNIMIPIKVGPPLKIKATSSLGDTIYAGNITNLESQVIRKDLGSPITDIQDYNLKIITHTSSSTSALKYVDLNTALVKGRSEELPVNPFEGLLGDNLPVTAATPISGIVSLIFSVPDRPDIEPDTLKLVYASPFVLKIDGITIQQGVVNPEKAVNGVGPLPLFTKKETYLELELDLENMGNFTYSSFDKIGIVNGTVSLKKDNILQNLYDIDGSEFQLIDKNGVTPGEFTPEDYEPIQLRTLQNSLHTFMPGDVFMKDGKYSLEASLNLTAEFYQKSDDVQKEPFVKEIEFQENQGFRCALAYAKFSSEEEFPLLESNDIGLMVEYVRLVYPATPSNINFSFNIPQNLNEKENLFSTLECQVQRHNKSNSSNTIDKILFIGTEKMMNIICDTASGCANKSSIGNPYSVGFVGYSEEGIASTVAHELGHLFGLSDTYTTKGAGNGPPNKVREENNSEGNAVDPGNINFITKTRSLKPDDSKNWEELTFTDFMGSADEISEVWVDRITWDFLFQDGLNLKKSNSSRSTNQYVAIAGMFDKSFNIELDPFILMPSVPYQIQSDTSGLNSIVFKDDQGSVLHQHKFNINFVRPEVGPVDHMNFAMYLPFDENTSVIEFYHEQQLLATKVITDNDPDILNFEGVVSESSTRYSFTWSANDVDGDSLFYTLEYSPNGEEFMAILLNSTDSSFTWTADDSFDPEKGSFKLIANDGIRESEKILQAANLNTTNISKINDEHNILIYPNPVKTEMQVDLSKSNIQIDEMYIINLLGQPVMSIKPERVSKTTLNLRHLTSGSYFLLLKSNDQIFRHNFILTHTP